MHEKPASKPERRRRRPGARVPRPPGASVEIRLATGTEPELLRHRAMLDAYRNKAFDEAAEAARVLAVDTLAFRRFYERFAELMEETKALPADEWSPVRILSEK